MPLAGLVMKEVSAYRANEANTAGETSAEGLLAAAAVTLEVLVTITAADPMVVTINKKPTRESKIISG